MGVLYQYAIQHAVAVRRDEQQRLNATLRQLLDRGVRAGNSAAAAEAMATHLEDSYRVVMAAARSTPRLSTHGRTH
jgi:DNA-binding GntR family transcriptional regulator